MDTKKIFTKKPISKRNLKQNLEYQVGVLKSPLQGGTACWQNPSANSVNSYTLYLSVYKLQSCSLITAPRLLQNSCKSKKQKQVKVLNPVCPKGTDLPSIGIVVRQQYRQQHDGK